MRIALLGSLQVNDGHTTLGPRDRVVLQALASRPGTELSPEGLAEVLWGEQLPETWLKVVQGCIVRLRKALGPDSIRTSHSGYRLVVHQDEVDHLHFEHLLARARELLANGEPERALYVTGQARELWRGEPLLELADWAPGRVEAERLVELWRDAQDLHAEASLRAGRYQDVLGDALRMVAEQPTRERRWGLLALAQYQAGRQGDALQTLHRAKTTLVNELGLDPGPELSQLEQAILRQDPSLAAQTVLPPTSNECPYLGLVGYDVADAPAFFGRDLDIAACLRRLDEVGILAVLGPSGCGKSSLARAGVAAALERDGRRVRVFSPGQHPTDALAATNPRACDVLVVDQCEEALALDPDSPERTEFFDQLVEFTARGGGLLVISLRADRLGELSAHPEFARLVERGLYLLGAMAEPDLRMAIEGPAAQAGLRLEPGLVDLLAREVEGEPAALPMLSHVLRQTWKRREGQTLTVAGYSATGGIREAISQSAEGLFRELTPEQQGMLRDLMVRLVAPDDTGEPVRQRVPRRSVATDEDHGLLIERLVGARLLSTGDDMVEIAHEALAVAWPRLRSWLDDDVDGLRILRHLTVAATSWDDLGRPDSELYRGVRAARAVEWHDRAHPSLPPSEQDFLTASATLAETEQRATEEQVRRERRSNQRLRAGLAAVAVLLAVAIVAGALAKTAADRADGQATSADARRLGAEALRAKDLGRAMLLAAAGLRLEDSVDTRSNLLASLERAPQLITTAHNGPIYTMSVNNATGDIATAADQIGLRLQDAMTLRKRPLPALPVGPDVTSSPDGRYFAYGVEQELTGDAGDPPAVLLLDRNGARAATQLGGLPLGRYADADLGFSPNSRWLAARLVDVAGQRHDVLAVWDLQNATKPVAVLDPGEQVHRPVVSADGRTLYSIGSGQLRVTTLPSGAVRRLLTAADLGVRDLAETLALSLDGHTLALAAGAEVVLLDTRSLTPRAYLSGAEGAAYVVFSRDGHRVASAGGRMVVWDVSAAEPLVLLDQQVDTGTVAFSPDGRTLYSPGGSGTLVSWDLDGDRAWLTSRFAPLTSGGAVVTRFSPDGRKVAYVFTGPPALQVRDVATGALGPLIPINQPVRDYIDVAWSPDSTVLNATTGDSRVATWDAATGRLLAEHRLEADGDAPDTSGGAVEGASIAFFSHDGEYLLVGSTTGRLHVLDARTLTPVRAPIRVPLAPGSTEPLAIARLEPSPDNHTALARTRDQVDYLTGQVGPRLTVLPEDAGPIYSPDGRRMFVTTSSGEVGLLDTASKAWISPLTAAQPFPAYIVAFSPDGAQVAAIARGRVGRWDGHTGAFLGSVAVPADGGVGFSRDDKDLRIAAGHGPVLNWDLRPATWVAAACRMAGRDLSVAEWRYYLPDRPFVSVCAS